MRQELDPRWGESLLPSMGRIAFDMRSCDGKYLEYQRFDHAHYKNRDRANPIKSQEELDLYEYLKPVAHYLPKNLAPANPFANSLVLPANTNIGGMDLNLVGLDE